MDPDTLRPRATGWYGKLSSRGDFVGRGLPRAWVRLWDDWLQRSLAAAAQELGAATVRERLLAMPPWRCVVLPSTPEQPVWCGVVVPSTDRIGRAFPLLLAEAYDEAAVDRTGLAPLHQRALRLRDWMQASRSTASPREFEAGVAALAATDWTGASESAPGSGETLGALRTACPDAGSFWWCVVPADIVMPPMAEPWPPRERLVLDWLGEGD